jgi:hypothetical protein
MIKEATLVTLVSAALIATVVRLFLYLLGGEEGTYLRQSIKSIGLTVVVLEVCIVMLRFFTTFQILNFCYHYFQSSNKLKKLEWFFFTLIGMTITYIWTTLPSLMKIEPHYKNDALIYLSNRPFEPVPIIVEYISLYLLNYNVISTHTSLTILCMSVISVIIAISDVSGNGNTLFVLPEVEPETLESLSQFKIHDVKSPISME